MFSSEDILIGIVYNVEKVIDVNIWKISGYYGSKGYGLDEIDNRGILMLFYCLNSSRLENTCKCLYHVTKRSHGTEISFGIHSNQLSLPHPHMVSEDQWCHL